MLNFLQYLPELVTGYLLNFERWWWAGSLGEPLLESYCWLDHRWLVCLLSQDIHFLLEKVVKHMGKLLRVCYLLYFTISICNFLVVKITIGVITQLV